MKTYKVWIHIEEIDEDNDSYEDVDLPEPVGEFEALADAEALVSRLQAVADPLTACGDQGLLGGDRVAG